MTNAELNDSTKRAEIVNTLDNMPVKDKTFLRLFFVDNIPKVTMLWLYKIRYRTMQNRLKRILGEFK